MKTFYIAASSKEIPRVRNLASKLITKFGWDWHNEWDWTDKFNDKEERQDPDELLECAWADLVSASDADVFLFLEGEASLGANREYGVRWGLAKEIYRVSNRDKHLFDLLPFVNSYRDEDLLIQSLQEIEA